MWRSEKVSSGAKSERAALRLANPRLDGKGLATRAETKRPSAGGQRMTDMAGEQGRGQGEVGVGKREFSISVAKGQKNHRAIHRVMSGKHNWPITYDLGG